MSRPRKHPLPTRTTLRVGPYDYTVQLVRGYIMQDGEECVGFFVRAQQLILISDQQCEAQRWSTLWHEIAHAWHATFGATRTFIGREFIEGVAEFVELGMAGVTPAKLRQLSRLCKAKAIEPAPAFGESRPRAAAAKRRPREARR